MFSRKFPQPQRNRHGDQRGPRLLPYEFRKFQLFPEDSQKSGYLTWNIIWRDHVFNYCPHNRLRRGQNFEHWKHDLARSCFLLKMPYPENPRRVVVEKVSVRWWRWRWIWLTKLVTDDNFCGIWTSIEIIHKEEFFYFIWNLCNFDK